MRMTEANVAGGVGLIIIVGMIVAAVVLRRRGRFAPTRNTLLTIAAVQPIFLFLLCTGVLMNHIALLIAAMVMEFGIGLVVFVYNLDERRRTRGG